MGGRGAGEERQGFSDTPFHCLRCVGGWGVQVVIYPCDADGTLHDVNNVYDDPNALLGQPLSFKFSLRGATLHKTKYAGGIEVQFTHKYCEDGRIFKTATAQGVWSVSSVCVPWVHLSISLNSLSLAELFTFLELSVSTCV
eukprot:m.780338 g.780338  ORF g.780338 m.780338 type:complete len:141 (-) comp23280_c2_seq29:920-1342(-)